MKGRKKVKQSRIRGTLRSILSRSMFHRPTQRHRDRSKYTRKLKHKKKSTES
jgi:hypothetical protein